MTRRRSDALRLFRALRGSRAAQTRSREWLDHRTRGGRPPGALGERASETNGRGYRLGNEWSRSPTGAEGIPRPASRGGHTHTHNTHTTRPRRAPLERRPTISRVERRPATHTHSNPNHGNAPPRRRGLEGPEEGRRSCSPGGRARRLLSGVRASRLLVRSRHFGSAPSRQGRRS